MEKLYIYIKDICVGELLYDRSTETYKFNQMTYGKEQDRAIYDLLLDCGSNGIRVGLEERYVPPYRDNIREILEMVGLHHYDRWELIRRTNGVVVTDPIWFGETPDMGAWFWKEHPFGNGKLFGKPSKRSKRKNRS